MIPMNKLYVLRDVYERLSSITGIHGVFSNIAPSDIKPPYITITALSESDGRLISNKEKLLTMEISVWSSYKGFKEITRISDEIYNALEQDYDFQSIDYYRDINNSEFYHCVSRYSVYITSDK